MWLIDTDRRVSTRLTTGGRSFSSAWTPDGERLVANGYHSGQGLFWQPLDGGAVEPLLVRENVQYAGSWSPDGSVHAFVEVAPETKRDVWLVSIDEEGDSRPLLNTRFEEYAPAFSPNGRFIAYVSDQSGRPEVYVRDYPGKTR